MRNYVNDDNTILYSSQYVKMKGDDNKIEMVICHLKS